MKLFIFILFTSIYFSFFELKLLAKENDEVVPNRITLTNGYLENTFNSNEGMAYFPMSIYETYDWGFRNLSVDNSVSSRVLSWLGSGFLQIYLNSTFVNTPYHEFGHATRLRSFGANNIIYYVDDNHSDTTGSYFGMVLKRIFYPFEGAATSGSIISNSTNDSLQKRLIVSAGGMNNEILLSKLLSERVYDRGGSVPDFFFYFENKISPYFYALLKPVENQGSDPTDIQKYYSLLGKNITRQDLQNSYLLSLFASGSLYSLLWGGFKYIQTAEHNVKSIDIYGFSLPDFSTYINSKGLSMEGMFHYKVNKNLSFALSYEKVYIGDDYDQITPELRYFDQVNLNLFKNYFLKSKLILGFESGNMDLGGSVEGEIVTEHDNGLFLRYTYYNKNTLYGERNIPFTDNSHEILGGFFIGLN